MFKRILKYIILVILCVVGYLSTFGWHFQKSSAGVYSSQEESLAESLERHVYALSHDIGWRSVAEYENLQRSYQYIADQFKQFGLEVSTQEISVDGKSTYNIIAEKKGFKHPEAVIIVGANYDTYSNPGANNNASGVSALIELARIFSAQFPETTIRFVAFVNKEPPFAGTDQMGSMAYVKLVKETKQPIEAVIIMDGIGCYSYKDYSQRYFPFLGLFYPDKGNFVMASSNINSAGLLKTVMAAFRKKTSFPIRWSVAFDFVDSDHRVFWREKYPAVLISDTGSYRNKHFHSLSDTYEKLNFRNMSQVTYGIAAVLRVLAW
ncbi:MAG: M28 family peptidase [Candidatus Omnitrophota bacterium]